MSVGFRKGEGTGTSTTGEAWQNSKLWNCDVCDTEKFRGKCVNKECKKFIKKD